MSSTYTIREATLDDNLGLIALVRASPMSGPIQVYLDRHPDFFALTRLQGERSFIYVAEDVRWQLIGSVVLIERQESLRGKFVKVLHIGDLRTHPSFRGSRIAAKFVEIYRKKLLEEPYHHGAAEIMAGNKAPIRAHRLLGEKIKVQKKGYFQLYQLLPLWTYRPSRRYHYRQAEAGDIPAIAKLLTEQYRHYSGSPAFEEPQLQLLLDQHPSFRLENFWLAEDHSGQILAAVATWDQKTLRRTIVVRFNWLFRLVAACLKGLSKLMPMPPPPEELKVLRYLHLRWPAAADQHQDALRQLLRAILRQVKLEREFQFVSIGFHKKDRLQRCLSFMIKVKSKIYLYTHQVERTSLSEPVAADETPFVDFSLV